MIRVVPDTNIFISALLFGGLPGEFLDLAFQGSFILITSTILLDELDEKLRGKFNLPSEDADLIRQKLEVTARIVTPSISLAVVKDDPDDDRVLECAITGSADYIVSGDKHLLRLNSYEGILILTARQFIDTLIASKS